jgi:ubiquinone/menaquinone biosynthesis C-methylase UbiE
VCRQVTGRTLELASGSGLNFRWYPAGVELVGVDLDHERVAVSSERARELDPSASVAVADGQRLPFTDGAFDSLVCTLAICDVSDRTATLTEAFRVIRPGGVLLLLDHYEKRWRQGRPAAVAEGVGFRVVERQRLWAGYFERVRLEKPVG